jgi:hypothetical protein
MDKTFILFLVICPIVIFFCGFAIARQMRPLENTLFFRLFIQQRLLICIITGFFFGALFTSLYSVKTGFSFSTIFSFFILFILVSTSEFYGMKLGWGKVLSTEETFQRIDPSTIQSSRMDKYPDNIFVEDFLSSIKIKIITKKRWVSFALELFQWVIIGLCSLPILSLILISWLQKYLPQNLNVLVWVLVGGLVFYLLYNKMQDALEYIYDHEIIEFDINAVRIEKYGWRFKSKKEYPADNIKKITAIFTFAGQNPILKRSPFQNSNLPVFMIWHNRGLRRFRTFGRGIDLADGQRILETVYTKFPQYKN